MRSIIRIVVVCVVANGVFLAAKSLQSEPAQASSTLSIAIDDCPAIFCYLPANVFIASGTTVTWTNNTTATHTVTRCTSIRCGAAGPGSGGDPAFDSGSIAALGTFSVTFTSAGTYNYFCVIHGYNWMHGTITVLAGATPTNLVASPAVIQTSPPAANTFTLSATLTDATKGSGIPGEVVYFFANGGLLCTAYTVSSGVASCAASTGTELSSTLGTGYQATFAGDSTYQGSSANAGLVG